METLNFSYNWNNKLNNKVYTTLRLSNRFSIGEIVEVRLKKVRMDNARVIQKKMFLLHHLDIFTAMLDTGYGLDETTDIIKKMYPHADWSTQYITCYLMTTNIKVKKEPGLFEQLVTQTKSK